MSAFRRSSPAQGPSFYRRLEIIDEIAAKIFLRFQHLSTPFQPLKPISSAKHHPTNHQKSTVTGLVRQLASPKFLSSDNLEQGSCAGSQTAVARWRLV
jgi:hypothetical protein